MIIQVDKMGRIVLRKHLREKYGKQFVLLDKGKEIVLRPLHLDMSDLAEKLEKYSASDFKRMAEEEAMKESGEALK